MTAVFDRGLQPERTALAWRRAALALGGASLLLARVFAETSVPLALAAGGGGVAAAIVLLVAVDRRYRSHHRRLVVAAGKRVPLAGGGLPVVVAAITLALGVAAAVAVTLSAVALPRPEVKSSQELIDIRVRLLAPGPRIPASPLTE